MHSCQAERRLRGFLKDAAPKRSAPTGLWLLLALVVLSLATLAMAREEGRSEGYDDVDRRNLDQIDIITEKLHRYGKVSLKVGGVLLGLLVLKMINPFQRYHSAQDRLLERAVRDVDELLKRIRREAETESEAGEAETETGDGGILAGMAEIAEFEQGEDVPSYVLTVNDAMLDSIRVTLKRLRRFKDARADLYREYMYAVLNGIKTITVESISADVPSSLAVDIKDYFQDERRYKAWQKLLSHTRETGENQEIVDSFLVFMKDIRTGRPLASPPSTGSAVQHVSDASRPAAPDVPEQLNEETLPVIQRAAVKEAKRLVSCIRKGGPIDSADAWQFELVRRQGQLRSREEAKQMLVVFLETQRKALPQITGNKTLPCRAWDHVLHLLGVAETTDLGKRIEDGLLSIQEIVILEKVFLQTFIKRASLEHIYGHGQEAELMIDLHLPQLRRESLALLRQCHETEPDLLDRATTMLNGEETPQRNQVKRLVEHYIHQRHDPPPLG